MAISIISMLIGFYVIEALASLFLVHGASNNKRLFLVPWLLERATQLIFYAVLWLSIGFYLFTSPQTIGYSMVTFVFGGFTLCKFQSRMIYDDADCFTTFSLQPLLLLNRLLAVRVDEGSRGIPAIDQRITTAAAELRKRWQHLREDLK
jgi:hypothetical protein